jgi:hypothetical protein
MRLTNRRPGTGAGVRGPDDSWASPAWTGPTATPVTPPRSTARVSSAGPRVRSVREELLWDDILTA